MSFKYLIKLSIVSSSLILIFSLSAEEVKVYQTDSRGNIQYHKPSAVVQKDGRIIETDKVGNKLYHKQDYQIKADKIYQNDSVGNIQYRKNIK